MSTRAADQIRLKRQARGGHVRRERVKPEAICYELIIRATGDALANNDGADNVKETLLRFQFFCRAGDIGPPTRGARRSRTAISAA